MHSNGCETWKLEFQKRIWNNTKWTALKYLRVITSCHDYRALFRQTESECLANQTTAKTLIGPAFKHLIIFARIFVITNFALRSTDDGDSVASVFAPIIFKQFVSNTCKCQSKCYDSNRWMCHLIDAFARLISILKTKWMKSFKTTFEVRREIKWMHFINECFSHSRSFIRSAVSVDTTLSAAGYFLLVPLIENASMLFRAILQNAISCICTAWRSHSGGPAAAAMAITYEIICNLFLNEAE